MFIPGPDSPSLQTRQTSRRTHTAGHRARRSSPHGAGATEHQMLTITIDPRASALPNRPAAQAAIMHMHTCRCARTHMSPRPSARRRRSATARRARHSTARRRRSGTAGPARGGRGRAHGRGVPQDPLSNHCGVRARARTQHGARRGPDVSTHERTTTQSPRQRGGATWQLLQTALPAAT